MAIWKQALVSIVIFVVALAAWVRYYPGSGDVLSRWGVELPMAATAKAVQEQPAAGRGAAVEPNVLVDSVSTGTINDRLSAIGTGRANNSVSVIPYSAGRLTEVPVKSGSRIEAGGTIAILDSEAEQIAFERAKLAVADAQAKLERAEALRRTNTVTTVQVKDAELAKQNAQLELRDAELKLSRRTIVAPVSGIVGILPVTVGNYVTTTTVVATIEDRSKILVDFWAPEKYASMIKVGDPLTARSIAHPENVYHGEVSAVDNRIDEKSRTLHVRGRITNPADTLRAGMAFRIEMRFPGDTYPSVNPLAIQWGTEGAFVWAVRDGKARQTPVTIIRRNTDSVLVDGPLVAGDTVVTEGIQTVREGAEIMIADRDSDGTAQTVPAKPGASAQGT
jgi:RND family efflux transporter MFP subunit